jgi:hypothetical protein
MRLSEMQHKDIIDLNGNKIGNIIDICVLKIIILPSLKVILEIMIG